MLWVPSLSSTAAKEDNSRALKLQWGWGCMVYITSDIIKNDKEETAADGAWKHPSQEVKEELIVGRNIRQYSGEKHSQHQKNLVYKTTIHFSVFPSFHAFPFFPSVTHLMTGISSPVTQCCSIEIPHT